MTRDRVTRDRVTRGRAPDREPVDHRAVRPHPGEHIGAEAGHVAAPVVDREQEPARQLGQPRPRAQRGVQSLDDCGQVGPAVQAGQRGGEHVAHPVVAWRREQPGPGQLIGERTGGVRRQPAQLDVPPRCELYPAVTQLGRQPRQRPHRPGADQPAG